MPQLSRVGFLGTALGGGGGHQDPLTPLKIVGTNGHGMDFAAAVTTTRLNWTTRFPFAFGADCDDVILSFAGWYSVDGVPTNNGGNIIIDGVALESNALTVTVPVRFSGSAAGITILPGDNDIQTAPLKAAAFGLPFFAKDTLYWMRIQAHIDSNITVGWRLPVTFAGTKQYRCIPANVIDQVYLTGALTAPSDPVTDSGSNFTPVAILGRPLVSGNLAVVTVDDSIGNGSIDTTTDLTGPGFVNRAMLNSGAISGCIAHVNFAEHGSTLNAWRNNAKLTAYFRYANVAFNQSCVNDAGSATSLVTNAGLFWAAMRAAGIQKIGQCYLVPRTTSIDLYITELNQTYVATTGGWGPGQRPDVFSAGIVTALGNGSLDFSYPMNPCRGVAPLKWVVNGAPNYATTDGLHPESPIHQLMAPELRTLLLAQVVT